MVIMTYWDKTGRYERESEILRNKYVPSSGMRLTYSNHANKALLAYLRMAHKYYRFYNDGDGISGMHSIRKAHMGGYHTEYPYDEHNERIAEDKMDKAIIRAWYATKGATLPVVDEIDDKEDYDVYVGRGKITYKSYDLGRHRSRKLHKVILND